MERQIKIPELRGTMSAGRRQFFAYIHERFV